VDVLDGAVGDSNVKAAINALKAVKLYGEMSVPQGPTAPDVIVRQHAAAKLDRERVPRNNLDRLVTELNSANYQARLADVEAEVRTLYFDP
jgi:hypothetical protein